MAGPNVAYRNFSHGEIAPAYYGRVDLSLYQSSLRTMRNFIVQKEGGAAMRPGFEYVAGTKSNGQARLIQFVSSDNDADKYICEFGNLYVRFHQNGAPVLNGGTPVEVVTPYTTADLPGLQFVQVANVMTLVHPNYAPRTLTRTVAGPPPTFVLATITFGPATAAPTGLSLTGGGPGLTTYWAVTAVNVVTGEESLPETVSGINHVPSVSNPVVLTWSIASGVNYNIYRSTDGVTYGFIETIEAGAAGTMKYSTWGTNFGSVSTSTLGSWQAGSTQVNIDPVASSATKATDGNYVVVGQYNLTAGPGATGTTQGRVHAYYSRDGEPQQDAGIIMTTPFLTGATSVSGVAWNGVVNVPDNGYSTLALYFTPEIFATAGSATYDFDIDETTAPNDYVTWHSAGTNFTDTGVAQDFTQRPPTDPGYFASSGNYPSAVGRYQQRQIFANSINSPGYIWASRTGSPTNFTLETPIEAASSFSFLMDSKKAIVIKDVLDLARLVAFTASEEKIIEGEVSSGILQPDAINARSVTYNGIASLRPLVVSDTALYVQARGNQVRMLKFGETSANADLTILSSHLFRRRTLVDWDYAFTPDSITWVVRSDGVLLGLTFVTDQDVWGWHHHDTQGFFENACVLPEGSEDRLYVVARRVINGSTVRYIERLSLESVINVTDIRDANHMDAEFLVFDGRVTDGSSVTYSSGILTASQSEFSGGDVGRTIYLRSVTAPNTDVVYLTVTGFTSSTQLTVTPTMTVPASLNGVATTDWARCSNTVTGVTHLAGMSVAVVGDGAIDSSPNNPNAAHMTLDGSGNLSGSIPQRSVIRVGLPFLADLETLDVDQAGSTVKTRTRLVSRVVAFLENSAPLWVGQATYPTPTSPTNNLMQMVTGSTGLGTPLNPYTADTEGLVLSNHNRHGRVFMRQVDPLPTTVLMIAPSFAEEY